MAKVIFFGDFVTNHNKHLSLSGELIHLLNTCDLKVANFEVPVVSKGRPVSKSGPNICQDIESVDWLKERSFSAVSLANNHIMDYGEEGLKATLQKFEQVPCMGAGFWKDAYKVNEFYLSDGIKIGVICCTHHEFGVLDDKFSRGGEIGCAWVLHPNVISLIQEGKNKFDYLVVMPHAGVEYMEQPLPEWREIYRLFIDLGADAVVASHPHVPQGWEFYKSKPICYSLGNFCFERKNLSHVPEHWYESLCCILNISAPHTAEMEIRPIVFRQSEGYICDNPAKEFADYLSRINSILSDEDRYMDYVNQYVLRLLPHYMGLFSRGGFVTGRFQKEYIKGFIEGFQGKGFWRYEHALNNIQCESHRWAILRALKLKNKMY